MNPVRERTILCVVCVGALLACACSPSPKIAVTWHKIRLRVDPWAAARIASAAVPLPPEEVLGPILDEFDAKVEALRAEGMPTTPAELERWYPPPPEGQNAAVVYREAFDHFVYSTDKQDKLLPVIGTWGGLPGSPPPNVKEAMEGFLASNAEALRLLHHAAALEHYRYPIDFLETIEAVKPDQEFPPFDPDHYSQIRHSVRLLMVEAWMHYYNSEMDHALETLITSLVMSQALAQEPFVISQLVSRATAGISLASLELLLGEGKFTDSHLLHMGTILRRLAESDAFTRAYIADRLIEESFSPDAVARMRGRVAYSMPDFDKTLVVHDACHVTLVGIAMVATAIERYRLAAGILPETLDDLVPDYLESVPIDPFAAAQVRYTRIGSGYVVWSLGQDGIPNEESHTRDVRRGPYFPDVTFIVQR